MAKKHKNYKAKNKNTDNSLGSQTNLNNEISNEVIEYKKPKEFVEEKRLEYREVYKRSPHNILFLLYNDNIQSLKLIFGNLTLSDIAKKFKLFEKESEIIASALCIADNMSLNHTSKSKAMDFFLESYKDSFDHNKLIYFVEQLGNKGLELVFKKNYLADSYKDYTSNDATHYASHEELVTLHTKYNNYKAYINAHKANLVEIVVNIIFSDKDPSLSREQLKTLKKTLSDAKKVIGNYETDAGRDLLGAASYIFLFANENSTLENFEKFCAKKGSSFPMSDKQKGIILSNFAGDNTRCGFYGIAKKQSEQAVILLTSALKDNKEDLEVKNALGIAYYNQFCCMNGFEEDATNILKKALKYGPADPSVLASAFIHYNVRDKESQQLRNIIDKILKAPNLKSDGFLKFLDDVEAAYKKDIQFSLIDLSYFESGNATSEQLEFYRVLQGTIYVQANYERGDYNNAFNTAVKIGDIVGAAYLALKENNHDMITQLLDLLSDSSKFHKLGNNSIEILKATMILFVKGDDSFAKQLLSQSNIFVDLPSLMNHISVLFLCKLALNNLEDLEFTKLCMQEAKEEGLIGAEIEILNETIMYLAEYHKHINDINANNTKTKVEEEPVIITEIKNENETEIQFLTTEEVLNIENDQFLTLADQGLIDPKDQHAFYQKQKLERLNDKISGAMIDNLNPGIEEGEVVKAAWNSSDMHYSSASFLSVYMVDENTWAVIDDKLKTHLEVRYLSAFENAIAKGVISNASHKNGIKFLGSLVELKINADTRLYTEEILINKNGNKLIVFNKRGDHEEIKRKNDNGKKVKFIYCDDEHNEVLVDMPEESYEYSAMENKDDLQEQRSRDLIGDDNKEDVLI